MSVLTTHRVWSLTCKDRLQTSCNRYERHPRADLEPIDNTRTWRELPRQGGRPPTRPRPRPTRRPPARCDRLKVARGGRSPFCLSAPTPSQRTLTPALRTHTPDKIHGVGRRRLRRSDGVYAGARVCGRVRPRLGRDVTAARP
ncbi:hypothetical protein EVAR_55209_1 [Eumeta japonica]|uniref:Uncharacterized protein n=1 Tax=Eumeta variegata TaxID=151549 RepID=A0A4C1ZKX8_EUMVA|nr:hypothetical protein EVAR_55209_1 [Eumeta japonica]